MACRKSGGAAAFSPDYFREGWMKASATRWTAWGNAFVIAVATLWAHKLRSLLTVFGIVIGIASVVLAGAILLSVRDLAVRSTAQSFGVNTFIISQVASVGDLTRKELADKLRRNPEIYRREAEQLRLRMSQAALLAPTLQSVVDIKADNRTFLAATIVGSTADIQTIRDVRVDSGRFFTEEENRRSRSVAIIGHDLVKELFPSLDPVGKKIRIKGHPFVVIGTEEKQGSSFASSLDRNVWIPLLAYEKIWGSRLSVTLYEKPKESKLYAETQDETRVAMRSLRGLKPKSEDNFDILVPEAGRSFLERLTNAIAIAIVPISSIALVVAGIVVMNMMLVSVTERTREIGIRKSLGARNSDVLVQILFESTLLTIIGGGIGLLFSYFGTLGLSKVLGANVHIPLVYAAIALGTAAVIGISAGFYPAYLAARMPPVEAMRSET
jgi:putative ABC transport system permease protein